MIFHPVFPYTFLFLWIKILLRPPNTSCPVVGSSVMGTVALLVPFRPEQIILSTQLVCEVMPNVLLGGSSCPNSFLPSSSIPYSLLRTGAVSIALSLSLFLPSHIHPLLSFLSKGQLQFFFHQLISSSYSITLSFVCKMCYQSILFSQVHQQVLLYF